IIKPSCAQSSNGAITANPTGGTAPYNYTWSDISDATQMRNDLTAGSYQLTVTDALGCSVQKTYALSGPASLELVNAILQNPTCFDDDDGNISLEVIGGVTPYSYQWAHGPVSTALNNIGAGNYTLTVTDNNGCNVTGDYTLTNPAPLTITGIPEKMTVCSGSTTAVAPEGAWSSYHWNGPSGFTANSHRVDVTAPGRYHLVTLNELGCAAEVTFVIEVSNDALLADFLRISEAIAYDPVVFVDISNPAPQFVEWILPDDADIVVNKESSLSIEVVFTRADTFEIGMIASMGTCQSEL